ncbi:hypothetical protein RUND412_004152 [Rhizina undulata]
MASSLPSSKEKKYDRQLRLWGINGQSRLESSHIALVNATATGCEVLKNLVLPGIGKFTIIDDKIVEEADLGVNFFLDESSLGKPRAERAAALLGELNPDVQSNSIVDSLSNLLATKPELFSPETTPFTHLLIIAPIDTSLLLKLPEEIPTFLVHSVGFTASLRIAAGIHPIVETHPESLVDLRLLDPWHELSDYTKVKTNLLDIGEKAGGMSDFDHGHVPYVLLILRYLRDWREAHQGKNPTDYAEKQEFKKYIEFKMRRHVPGGSEENYDEAVAAVLKHVRPHEISGGTRAVLKHPKCKSLSQQSDSFWIIARAVKEFIKNSTQGGGLLPLPGSIPDMKAESHGYMALQTLYRYKARGDLLAVQKNVQALLSTLGLPDDAIPYTEIENFCRQANFIRVLEFRPIKAEYSQTPNEIHKKAVVDALQNWDAEESLVHDYIALRAWSQFIVNTGRIPGEGDDVEKDVEELKMVAERYLESVGWKEGLGTRGVKAVEELVRTGGGELHVNAALIGGIVAQEVIKIVTKQYVPANNTVVFDGIGSKSMVFRF